MEVKGFYLLVLMFAWFFVSCSNTNKAEEKLDFIIKDSLQEAIAKEKLQNVGHLLKEDVIYILPLTQKSENNSTDIENYFLDQEIIPMIPSHIDRWTLVAIDSNYLKTLQTENNFYYVLLLIGKSDNDYRVDIICEVEYPQKDTYIKIDRGRLTIIFDSKSEIPLIKKMWKYWG